MSTEPWDPKFHSYSSIESHGASIIKSFHEAKVANYDWIVCEKIHGANFSFTTNGTEVVCSRRKGRLEPNESFFNYQVIRDKYREAVLRCWEVASGRGLIEADAAITIYGELFGGIYLHPSIAVDPKSGAPVQKEVQYCPHKDFLAFDIRRDSSDGSDSSDSSDRHKSHYLDMDVVWSVLDEAGVPYIKPLKTGCTFEEALAFDPKFQTTVPALFGLPEIKDNFAEGVTIRPIKNLRVKGNRAILKIKYDGFKEQTPEKWKKIKENNTTVAFNEVLEQLKAFVNENRLVAVLSKEGELTKENREEIMNLLVDDAMQDYKKEEDLREKFDGLTKSEQTALRKTLKGMAMKVIIDH